MAQSLWAGTPVVQFHGGILVDSAQRTLYLFDPDAQGNSTCYDDCAQVWPPLLLSATPEVLPPNVGIVTRTDGTKQVTYKKNPLYYFRNDKKVGDRKGDGLGGVWHILPEASDDSSEGDSECHPRRFTDLVHKGGNDPFTFECKSTDACLKRCSPTAPNGRRIRDARLVKRTSDAPCGEGISWGHEMAGSVWVESGCGGIFEAFTY